MGLTNFILTCEKDNDELRKGLNYYKNYTNRLKKENKQLKEVINKSIEYVEPLLTNHDDLKSYCILSYNKIVLLEILKEVTK